MPRIKPRSPTLQVDSLPAELPGKPHRKTYRYCYFRIPHQKDQVLYRSPYCDLYQLKSYFLEQKIFSFSAILLYFQKIL